MTIRELFDCAAPNCFYKNQALHRLRNSGVKVAVDYLIKNGANAETLRVLEGIETKNHRYIINVKGT